MMDALFQKVVQTGNLTLQVGQGPVRSFGDGTGPAVSVHIKSRYTALRIALNPYRMLGEAFMDGDLVIAKGGDLYTFLEILTKNLGRDHRQDPALIRFRHSLRHLIRRFLQYNLMRRSKRNVAHHYDLSGELYRLFLDSGLNYSCAYFKSPDDDLETAQNNKLALIAKKLRTAPGMHVLDIGCGWGSMALWLAQHHGVQVTGVTLSEEQAHVAKERVKKAGLSHKVDILLKDYREVEGQFDRIVSIGMFEHVGLPFYHQFFETMAARLKPDGVALLHHITRSSGPSVTNSWLNKYIFPGGYSPALSEVMPHIERSGLVLTDAELLRLHYAQTLKLWRTRFMKNREKAAALYDDRFCRMWEFYLAGSELSLRYGGHLVVQWQLAHDQEAVPLTRDYLYQDELSTNANKAEQLHAKV